MDEMREIDEGFAVLEQAKNRNRIKYRHDLATRGVFRKCLFCPATLSIEKNVIEHMKRHHPYTAWRKGHLRFLADGGDIKELGVDFENFNDNEQLCFRNWLTENDVIPNEDVFLENYLMHGVDKYVCPLCVNLTCNHIHRFVTHVSCKHPDQMHEILANVNWEPKDKNHPGTLSLPIPSHSRSAAVRHVDGGSGGGSGLDDALAGAASGTSYKSPVKRATSQQSENTDSPTEDDLREMLRYAICSNCGNKYEKHKKLLKHWKKRHGEIVHTTKPFACPLCDYSCKEFVTIKRHFSQKHKPGQDSSLRPSLDNTLRRGASTGGTGMQSGPTFFSQAAIESVSARPFDCPLCSINITSVDDILPHLRSVHQDSDWSEADVLHMINLYQQQSAAAAAGGSSAPPPPLVDPDVDIGANLISPPSSAVSSGTTKSGGRKRRAPAGQNATGDKRSKLSGGTGRGSQSYGQWGAADPNIPQFANGQAGAAGDVSGSAFKCGYCGTIAENEEAIRNHMIDRHVKELGGTMSSTLTFTCYQCGQEFESDAAIEQHLLTDHNQQPPPHLEADEVGMAVDSLTAAAAPVASALSPPSTAAATNILSMPGAPAPPSYPSHSSDLSMPGDEIHQIDPYRCIHCPTMTQFPTKEELHSHLVTHAGLPDSQFMCTLCGRAFKARDGLMTHKKRKHHDTEILDYPLSCRYCEQRFTSFKSQNTHMTSRHLTHLKDRYAVGTSPAATEDGLPITDGSVGGMTWSDHSTMDPYLCIHCRQKFAAVSELTYHLEEHRLKKEVSDIICVLCGKEFGTDNGLISHKRRKHKEPSDMTYLPVACDYCENRFQSVTDKSRHVNTFHLTTSYTDKHQQQVDSTVQSVIAPPALPHQVHLQPSDTATFVESSSTSVNQFIKHGFVGYADEEEVEEDEVVDHHQPIGIPTTTAATSNVISDQPQPAGSSAPILSASIATITATTASTTPSQSLSATAAVNHPSAPGSSVNTSISSSSTPVSGKSQATLGVGNTSSLPDIAANTSSSTSAKIESGSSVSTSKEVDSSETEGMTSADFDPFLCPQCETTYASATDLQQHIMSYHTTIEQHLCMTCGQSFATAEQYQKHNLHSHTNGKVMIRPKACPLCPIRLHTHAGRVIHLRSEHNTTWDSVKLLFETLFKPAAANRINQQQKQASTLQVPQQKQQPDVESSSAGAISIASAAVGGEATSSLSSSLANDSSSSTSASNTNTTSLPPSTSSAVTSTPDTPCEGATAAATDNVEQATAPCLGDTVPPVSTSSTAAPISGDVETITTTSPRLDLEDAPVGQADTVSPPAQSQADTASSAATVFENTSMSPEKEAVNIEGSEKEGEHESSGESKTTTTAAASADDNDLTKSAADLKSNNKCAADTHNGVHQPSTYNSVTEEDDTRAVDDINDVKDIETASSSNGDDGGADAVVVGESGKEVSVSPTVVTTSTSSANKISNSATNSVTATATS